MELVQLVDNYGSGKLSLEERAGILKHGDSRLRSQHPGALITVVLFSSLSDMTLPLE
jgi:hypothetical protein